MELLNKNFLYVIKSYQNRMVFFSGSGAHEIVEIYSPKLLKWLSIYGEWSSTHEAIVKALKDKFLADMAERWLLWHQGA